MFTQLLAGLRGTTQNFEAPGAITILRGSLSTPWVEWAGGEKSNQYPGAVSRGESQPATINLTGGSQPTFLPPSHLLMVSSLDESNWKPNCKEPIHWSMEINSPCPLQWKRARGASRNPSAYRQLGFSRTKTKLVVQIMVFFYKMHTYGTVII